MDDDDYIEDLFIAALMDDEEEEDERPSVRRRAVPFVPAPPPPSRDGAVLRALRLQYGVTLADLGRELDLPVPALTAIESSTTPVPQAQTWAIVAAIARVAARR